jgi:Protein of unknown function (DUF1566)
MLAAGAALGANPTDWACTKDNDTGLIWEVKTATGTDLRFAGHTYTWFDANQHTNGGDQGSPGSTNTCNATLPGCQTENFRIAVNAAMLCGANDWRMPTLRELRTLVHFGAASPAIDTTYFPNTVAATFWSGSSYVPFPNFAWYVNYNVGIADSNLKANSSNVRLVRGGQF